MNKKFRMAQKALDRDVTHVTTAATGLSTSLSKPTMTVQEVTGLLDGVSQRLTTLKRKVELASSTDSLLGIAYVATEY